MKPTVFENSSTVGVSKKVTFKNYSSVTFDYNELKKTTTF